MMALSKFLNWGRRKRQHRKLHQAPRMKTGTLFCEHYIKKYIITEGTFNAVRLLHIMEERGSELTFK